MPDPIEKMVDEGKLTKVEKILDEAQPRQERPGVYSNRSEGLQPLPPPKASAPPATGASSVAGPLAKLREAVPPHYISSLPKQTKSQKEELQKDRSKGIRCALCHGWHHRDALHVPYVGHAAVTDRLLEVDPLWAWEPVAWTPEGLPRFDASGGMWIKLTVAGMTRLGYGHGAQKAGQDPGAREKEVIGDALRNAAMRFGVALDLWHKGELHPDGEGATDEVDDSHADPVAESIAGAPDGTYIDDEQRDRILAMAASARVEARTICDRYGIDALPQLHADDFERVMQNLRATIEKNRESDKTGTDQLLDDGVTF